MTLAGTRVGPGFRFRADLGRERVAAMLYLIHGQAASYQVGWSSDKGRELAKELGTEWYD